MVCRVNNTAMLCRVIKYVFFLPYCWPSVLCNEFPCEEDVQKSLGKPLLALGHRVVQEVIESLLKMINVY